MMDFVSWGYKTPTDLKKKKAMFETTNQPTIIETTN
jgi:hypothetical protein